MATKGYSQGEVSKRERRKDLVVAIECMKMKEIRDNK